MSGVAPKIARVGDKWRWVKPDVREKEREREKWREKGKERDDALSAAAAAIDTLLFSSFSFSCSLYAFPFFSSPRAQRAERKD